MWGGVGYLPAPAVPAAGRPSKVALPVIVRCYSDSYPDSDLDSDPDSNSTPPPTLAAGWLLNGHCGRPHIADGLPLGAILVRDISAAGIWPSLADSTVITSCGRLNPRAMKVATSGES